VTSRRPRSRARWTPVALCIVLTLRAGAAHAQDNTRAVVLPKVNTALSVANSGRFTEARRNLETVLAGCGAAASGLDCRVLSAAGLGAVLQRQGSVDRKNRDSLYTASVVYYDRILREVPNNPDAIYGKALAYRVLGPRESMEPFFKQAPSLDSARASLYFTFQGDYFASMKRLPEAAAAYRQAVRQDGENDGARAGLVDALVALGQQASLELLQSGRDWESRYPESAAGAYRAVLINSFAPGGQRDAIADSAMLGLVRVQTRNRLGVGDVPREVSPTWTPVREIRNFLDSARATVAPWWRQSEERQTVLAQSALAGGKAATTAARYDAAEHLFAEGVRIAHRASSVSLDLQRELALLYFHHPQLDPGHRKFDALEQDIFDGKMGALASGDLEAAQRYHTTLGLIYAERGTWTSPMMARNAEQQLGWALDKADERAQRQHFYQPLPELRRLLAHAQDSLGHRGDAARRYGEAAKAFLDADDLTAADSAARNALRVGSSNDATLARSALVLRSNLGLGGVPDAACTPDRIATLGRAGDAAFIARQRFKLFADCADFPVPAARAYAIEAFKLADSARVTLVGGNDVARLERIMRMLLQPVGIAPQSGHLDPVPSPGGPLIQVSVGGETVPYWYAAVMDDIVAARVVSALGATARPFVIRVSAGVVTVPRAAAISAQMLARLKSIPGVREIHIEARAAGARSG
jgi:tetratricopeptide (TPR) repeat protein